MFAPREVTQQRSSRMVFDLVQGYMLTTVIAALEIAGLMSELQDKGISKHTIPQREVDPVLLSGMLRYLTERGITYEDEQGFQLSAQGYELCRDKGYLAWLSGGYGHVVNKLDSLLLKKMTYGKDVLRDGYWVAVGTALVGKPDVLPFVWRTLEDISFNHILDLGCGSARFLSYVCQAFGCTGIGVDLSPDAYTESKQAIANEGLEERVQIVLEDATDLNSIPRLDQTDLVSAFFLLHEIFALGEPTFINYLKELNSRLPDGAYLMIVEVTPPQYGSATPELFTPEYGFLHSVMKQTLATEAMWRDMLTCAGFQVRQVVPMQIPGTIMILSQSTK